MMSHTSRTPLDTGQKPGVPMGRRTVLRWASNPPYKKLNATETPTKEIITQKVLGGTPAVGEDISYMTMRGQSRKEAFDPTKSLTSPRHQVRVGAWNVQTMYETGRTAQVIREMQRYRLNILGLSEIRWTGAGKYRSPTGETIYYSGREDGLHRSGVGIVLDKNTNKSLMEWEPVDHRILRVRFFSRFSKLTIIQCYAPTEDSPEDDKNEFYEKLQVVMSKVNKHDVLLLTGDFNAKVGSDNSGFEQHIGKHGLGTRNDNGGRFLDLAVENNLVIGGTVFRHKDIHKVTWNSPDGRTKNQIDHIAINRRWRSSLLDVKAIRGGDIGSDHNLVLSKIRLKLKKTTQKTTPRLFDSAKLRDKNTKEAFSIELSNRFHLLQEVPIDDLNLYCTKIQEMFTTASECTLGYKSVKRKPWISDDTWKLIEERKVIKQRKIANSNCERSKEELNTKYKIKHKEVRSSAKKDKRTFVEGKATEAQEAAAKGDSRTLYKITKELTGRYSSQTSTVVKDKNGKILSNEADQCARWAEHFKSILNREDPKKRADIQERTRELEMKRGMISCLEIEKAIAMSKCNRAPGEDRITADMAKADPKLSAQCLVTLFNKVWKEEKVPEAWKRGIIIKLPKKGDLTDCGNWRGINLLSIVSKLFCRVLLNRIKDSIDKNLREEQAGFRAGRSCVDQIFVLRTIIEQSLEWNSSTYINFIDFEKAFDSVHHETMWKILWSYGFPVKIINILKDMYASNQCCVRHGGQHSEWFRVMSGVRQGCVISPLLFLIVVDWVMKKSTADKPRGIQWGFFKRLEDEDFADDIALVAHSQKDIQEKTGLVESYASAVGLTISEAKSKIMKMNTKSNENIRVKNKALEEVNEFKYLGSFLTTDSDINKEITSRIIMASSAFYKLGAVWKAKEIKLNTKLKLYISNVRSVLLYAAETWRTNRRIESRLRGFEGRCLRRLLHVRWEDRVTNKEVARRTGIQPIVSEVKHRRWKWLGHILRMNKARHPLVALTWTPQGKRKRGRPHGTWRRSVDAEREEAGKTWNELKWLAQDRDGWRSFVGDLCFQGSEVQP